MKNIARAGEEPVLDCLIVGGGPAGLTVAIYLARFRRRLLMVDAGVSRAALVPESHNYPGFTAVITGDALLVRLRGPFHAQAPDPGARPRSLAGGEGAYRAHCIFGGKPACLRERQRT